MYLSDNLKKFLLNLHPDVLKKNAFLYDMKHKSISNNSRFSTSQQHGIEKWSKNDKISKDTYDEWKNKYKPIREKFEIILTKFLENKDLVDEGDLLLIQSFKESLVNYNYISKYRLKKTNTIFMKYFPNS